MLRVFVHVVSQIKGKNNLLNEQMTLVQWVESTQCRWVFYHPLIFVGFLWKVKVEDNSEDEAGFPFHSGLT